MADSQALETSRVARDHQGQRGQTNDEGARGRDRVGVRSMGMGAKL